MTETHYSQSWRAKLFLLSFDGQWNDIGTGQLFIDNNVIKLESEDTPGHVILTHPISDEVYKR